jgi:hypothetical protein
LVNIGGGGRTGVIARLRRVLSSALYRDPGATEPVAVRDHPGSEAARRIEAARRRLKAEIPHREE